MDFSNQLFDNASLGIDCVLEQGCQIFAAHWKPLVIITFLRILSISGTFFILALFTFHVTSAYIQQKLVSSIAEIMPNNSRYLLDYSVGVSGASRLLLNGNYYTDNQNGADDSDIDAKFIIIVMALVVLWTFAISLVISIFDGAMYHALAQIYAGSAPSPIKSVERGFAKKWNVYGFKLLYSCAIIGLMAVYIGVIIGLASVQASFSVRIRVSIALFVVLMIPRVLLSAICVAVIPAIVVEGKSAVQGFKRSLILSKKFICFILCSELSYRVVFWIAAIVLDLILGFNGFLFGFLGKIALLIVMITFEPM